MGSKMEKKKKTLFICADAVLQLAAEHNVGDSVEARTRAAVLAGGRLKGC